MTANEPSYLDKFLDLVVKQSERLEESFKDFKREVTVKIDEQGSKILELDSRVGSLERKTEKLLQHISNNGSGEKKIDELDKKIAEMSTSLVKISNDVVGNGTRRKNTFVIWGKQFYLPSWAVFLIVSIVSLLVGASVATGNVGSLLEFILKIFGK